MGLRGSDLSLLSSELQGVLASGTNASDCQFAREPRARSKLNPWFLQIVEAGTGKQFTPADNADWPRVTRPIVEAFFHARFYLEIAVRYAHIAEPPRLLPSGYAALLYLYGLR